MTGSRLSYRNPKRGVVLIATLISLVLVVGLALVFQSSAIANTRTIKTLSKAEQRQLNLASVRELSRPLVAEAMLQFDGEHRLPLDGTTYEVAFLGTLYFIKALDETTDATSTRKQPNRVAFTVD